jgi:signal transduction histidine kinase
MKRAAEHLLSLVNDVLDLSRVEAGQIYLCAEEIDLRSFLDGLSESVRPLASAKSLTYSVEVAPDLPSIMTDGTRLRQVLLNLLSNAVKFTDSGSVSLRAAPDGPTDRVRIAVLDTGIGIDEAHRESIFEQFTQADQSATRSRGGAGLGLAISRKLVRMMGGTLDLESTFGEGSTFSVELPLVPPTGWVGSDPEVPPNAPR